MASLNMGISYELTEEKINEVVDSNRIGNYAYGYLNDEGIFIVRYVGRSDSDLRERLKHGLYDNNPESTKYERFKFSYASSPGKAYEKECRNYHDFGGEEGRLVNDVHPAKPQNSSLSCPICGN